MRAQRAAGRADPGPNGRTEPRVLGGEPHQSEIFPHHRGLQHCGVEDDGEDMDAL
jgi:hypothetical protein